MYLLLLLAFKLEKPQKKVCLNWTHKLLHLFVAHSIQITITIIDVLKWNAFKFKSNRSIYVRATRNWYQLFCVHNLHMPSSIFTAYNRFLFWCQLFCEASWSFTAFHEISLKILKQKSFRGLFCNAFYMFICTGGLFLNNFRILLVFGIRFPFQWRHFNKKICKIMLLLVEKLPGFGVGLAYIRNGLFQ